MVSWDPWVPPMEKKISRNTGEPCHLWTRTLKKYFLKPLKLHIKKPKNIREFLIKARLQKQCKAKKTIQRNVEIQILMHYLPFYSRETDSKRENFYMENRLGCILHILQYSIYVGMH